MSSAYSPSFRSESLARLWRSWTSSFLRMVVWVWSSKPLSSWSSYPPAGLENMSVLVGTSSSFSLPLPALDWRHVKNARSSASPATTAMRIGTIEVEPSSAAAAAAAVEVATVALVRSDLPSCTKANPAVTRLTSVLASAATSGLVSLTSTAPVAWLNV